MSYFNGAIETYRRTDNPNVALPAAFIYPAYIETTRAGFYMDGLIKIELVRNKGTNNRGSIYQFNQGTLERLVLTLCYSNEFFVRNLNREAPYIVQFGEGFKTEYENPEGTSTLSIRCRISFQEYKRWISKREFTGSGNPYRETVSSSPDRTRIDTIAGNFKDVLQDEEY